MVFIRRLMPALKVKVFTKDNMLGNMVLKNQWINWKFGGKIFSLCWIIKILTPIDWFSSTISSSILSIRNGFQIGVRRENSDD